MKKSISSIIDTILIFIVTAFFAMAVSGYFLSGATNIIAASLTVAISTTALISIFKHKKGSLSLTEVQNVLNQFVFNNKAFAHEHIKNALSKKHDVKDFESYLRINSTFIFIRLTTQKLSQNELINIYVEVKDKAKQLTILTIDGADKASQSLLQTLPDIKINILGGEKVYLLLKSLDALPKIEFTLKRTKLNYKELLQGAASPSKAKGYFLTALVLIMSSLLVTMPIYYLVVASMCLTMGIVCVLDLVKRLNPQES